ncbi:MAG: AbrB/MazE/SpoVT family DNA-binding domain-containing protein [Verrucomicrobiota bacterium]
MMDISTLSPKYQTVIPKKIRKEMNLQPGQQLQFTVKDGRIEIQPILSGQELIGYLKETKPLEFNRDADRKL